MCAQARPRFIVSSRRVFREWNQNPCLLQGKNPLYRKLGEGSNQRCCIMQDSEPNTLPTELFRPPISCNTLITLESRNSTVYVTFSALFHHSNHGMALISSTNNDLHVRMTSGFFTTDLSNFKLVNEWIPFGGLSL